MKSLPVIPNFDVFKDGTACRGMSLPMMTIEQLPTQGGKEALSHRVVITVGAPTHAGCDLMRRQQLTIFGGRVLHPAISVMQQAWLWLAAGQGHAQSSHTQFGRQRLAHGPTHHHATAQIQQDGQTISHAAAQQPHRELLAVTSDAGVLRHRSFAKSAAAFFKTSRSWVTSSSSLRPRRTSCSGLATLPSPGNTSVSVSSLAST